MSEWFKRLIKEKRKPLCNICQSNKLPEEPATIQLQVQEGIVELHICDECADFFDKSAEVLAHRGKDKKSDEPI